ncbi:MAG TPA: hypothetical protein VK438_10065 [Xanthobacteraceae bacterium]|nr:hypothetical protein [Xanthobacteraceae bacterium]
MLALFLVFVLVERAFSPPFQQCVSGETQPKEGAAAKKDDARSQSVIFDYIRCTGEFLDRNQGTLTALATIVIAAFTGTLWVATHKQSELTRQTLVSDKRAFVFAAGFTARWEPSEREPGKYNWRFAINWQNSGETATRNLRLYSDCILMNSPITPNFDLISIRSDSPPGPGMLGPKAGGVAGNAPLLPQPAITPQDILDVQQGRRFLYLWGWARYNDVMPDTNPHITRFCWQILAHGDPIAFDASNPTGVQFYNAHLGRGNCADEECVLQGLG